MTGVQTCALPISTRTGAARSWLAMLAMVVGAFSQQSLAAEPLTPCRVPGLRSAAQCGVVQRALDPARPAGTQIEVHYLVVPALARRKLPDPVFFLAGGPGQSAIRLAPTLVQQLGRLNNRRDLVFVDQRGTGKSAPLLCREDRRATLAQSLDPQRRDAFRVNPPETYPVECVIRSMGDAQNVYRVLDLSPEGLALMLGPGHPTPESGESWSHCRIEIPGYPPIPCDLVVRFVSDTLMGDGQSRRIGCEFDRPSPQAQRALQIYVTDLQSGRYQRLAN